LGNSQKFYFRAPFAQNGAETNWNISPSYVGDTPPAGFSLQMSSAGVISITCPSFAGAGLVNYALNAPAVGATFPLAVDASSLTTGTVAAARLPVVVPGTSAGVVAAAGLPGNTTGSAVAAGYVGEVKTGTYITGTVASSGNWKSIYSISLTAGIWVVFGKLHFYNGSTAPTTFTQVATGISTTQDGVVSATDELRFTPITAANFGFGIPFVTQIINISSTQTYYLNGSATYTALNSGTWTTESQLKAVRIA
jgi:hypothetical protein